MDLKKICQDVILRKKVSAFWKKYNFSDRNARKYSKSKINFKMCFWGSSATSILNFIFFLKSWDFFLHKTRNFHIGIRTGS